MALPTSVVAVVVVAAALPATAPAACAGADASLSALDRDAARGALLCAVNEQRAGRGLRLLSADPDLTQAAQGHGDAMVAQQFFDHVSPGGATLVDRVRATGWLRGTSYTLSEAIAWAGAPLDTAAHVVGQWMDSPPHRAIVLDPRFGQAGLGVAAGVPTGGGPGATVVLDAGTRAGAPAAGGAPKPASKVGSWGSGRRCAKAARRSRRAHARCGSTSRRSSGSIRARPLSSILFATTSRAPRMTSRATF